MRRSAWVITASLVVLALALAWFFGLDARHAVVLVGSAFAAGVANALLESVDLQRPSLVPVPTPPRGLADVQALEFSLAAAEPGMRGVVELHGTGRTITRTRPGVRLSRSLTAFLDDPHPRILTHRELSAFLEELERIAHAPDNAQRTTHHNE